MDADLLTVLDRTILNSQKMLKPSADTLRTTLNDFTDVTRLKAQINRHNKNVDLETKLRSVHYQNDKRNVKLSRLWTDFRTEIGFLKEIITQNCALIIQQQQNYRKLVAKEKFMIEYEMIAKQKKLQQKREQIYKIQLFSLRAVLENIRASNIQDENEERNRWNMKKEELKDILMKYDAKMFTQQEELEYIQCILNREEEELQYFAQAYTIQENLYNELMKEKEEYLEQQRQQKLYEIRLKIATRTIVKFIEDHYPAWKTKKLKASKKKGKYKFNINRKK